MALPPIRDLSSLQEEFKTHLQTLITLDALKKSGRCNKYDPHMLPVRNPGENKELFETAKGIFQKLFEQQAEKSEKPNSIKL